MRISPIIPIWLMAILCVVLVLLKRRNGWGFVRQCIMVILIFVINLRPFLPGDVTVQGMEYNRQIILAFDDTISMIAEDAADGQSRLDAAKSDCGKIIEAFPDSKYSVITFHNTANILTPLTGDIGHVQTIIEAVTPLNSLYAKGSNISTAKPAILDTAKRAKNRGGSVILIFFGDGENTDEKSTVSFEEIAKYIDGGAVLGYGSEKGSTMEETPLFGDEKELIIDERDFKFETAVTKIDKKILNQVADDMKIEFYHMESKEDVTSVIRELQKIPVNTAENAVEETEEQLLIGAKDLYPYMAIILAGLLITEGILFVRKRG